MKILSQLNRSLEESEEEWALVEMLGAKFVIRLERGDEQPTEYGDVEWFTLEEMGDYPKTLRILMEKSQIDITPQEEKYGGAGSQDVSPSLARTSLSLLPPP